MISSSNGPASSSAAHFACLIGVRRLEGRFEPGSPAPGPNAAVLAAPGLPPVLALYQPLINLASALAPILENAYHAPAVACVVAWEGQMIAAAKCGPMLIASRATIVMIRPTQ